MKKDFTPTHLGLGKLNIYLARHFGFCYGVENAIEISFRTIAENPGKRIFLLSEMIHNPQVNRDLQEKGVVFLQDTSGNELIAFDSITPDDVVIIPAFGTTMQMEEKLRVRGIPIEKYNTTCPFVEKVWNRSAQIASKGYTIVIHGKPNHEETRATFSHASSGAPAIIICNLEEAALLGRYITGKKNTAEFYADFAGRLSPGFDVTRDLQKIGVVNQTTQLATETQAIADYLKSVLITHYSLTPSSINERFADTKDTLCYATNDNQSAVTGMLETPADLAIIVGGYNSSNTTHLVELCEQKLPAYFINSASKLLSAKEIMHYDYHQKKEIVISDYLPSKTPVNVLMTSGASCPDALVEEVIQRLAEFFQVTPRLDELIRNLEV